MHTHTHNLWEVITYEGGQQHYNCLTFEWQLQVYCELLCPPSCLILAVLLWAHRTGLILTLSFWVKKAETSPVESVNRLTQGSMEVRGESGFRHRSSRISEWSTKRHPVCLVQWQLSRRLTFMQTWNWTWALPLRSSVMSASYLTFGIFHLSN